MKRYRGLAEGILTKRATNWQTAHGVFYDSKRDGWSVRLVQGYGREVIVEVPVPAAPLLTVKQVIDVHYGPTMIAKVEIKEVL